MIVIELNGRIGLHELRIRALVSTACTERKRNVRAKMRERKDVQCPFLLTRFNVRLTQHRSEYYVPSV